MAQRQSAQGQKQGSFISGIMMPYSSKQYERMKEEISRGADVNLPDDLGRFPLIVAVMNDQVRYVELLLSRGANPNINNTGALFYAIDLEHITILKMLVEAGANVNARNQFDIPVIANVKNINKIMYLLEHGVDPNTIVGAAKSPYLFQLILGHHNSAIQLLVDKGADVTRKDLTGNTAIMKATQNNYDDLVDFFIKKGVDVNSVNEIGTKAIDLAVTRENMKTIDILFAAGATVDSNTLRIFLKLGKKQRVYDIILSKLTETGQIKNLRDKDGKPLLFDVVDSVGGFKNTYPLVEFIDKSGDIDIKYNNYTAFFLPQVLTSPALITLFIKKGADSSILLNGMNLIHYLIKYGGDVKSIKTLATAGVAVDQRSADGVTPLLYSVVFNSMIFRSAPYIDTLLELGADINAVENAGLNALHLAFMSHNKIPSSILSLVEKLVGLKVDYNKKSLDNTTPFYLACATPVASEEWASTALYLLRLPEIDYTSVPTDTNKSPVEVVAQLGIASLFKALLVKGIDKTLALSNGSTLVQNAKAGLYPPHMNELIIDELEDDTSGLWRGYTKSDVSKLDTIFDTALDNEGRVPAANLSMCPVCHGFVYRGEACKYMYHNCSLEGHLYHKKLYDMYKSPEGRIAWCTVCGRICKGHRHYVVSTHTPVPALVVPYAGADLFSDDCLGPERGGGITEKLVRFRKLREVSRELNTKIGTITVDKAFKKQVEATWDAPYVWIRSPVQINIAKMKAEKKFNIPENNFPNAPAVFPSNVPEKENWNKKNFPDVVRTPAEQQGYKVPLVVSGKNHGGSQNTDIPVIMFHHVRRDGTINDHEGRYISPEYLELILKSINKEFKGEEAEKFGYCWDYGQGCTARLFPDEVQPFIDNDTFTEYRRKFNWKFAAQGGGATTPDFFYHIPDATCGLPPRPSRKGGRRTTRNYKGLKKRTITRRKR